MADTQDMVVWSQDRDIIAAVASPADITHETGFILFIHGHGNNRFQYATTMRKWSRQFNLIAVCAEYRDSGRDSGMGIRGAKMPYDGNYKQTMDSLNSMRTAMLEYPDANQNRVLVWGGSQGAGQALLCAAFAPHTFAAAMALCGRARPPEDNPDNRPQHEIAIRTVANWLERVRCPVLLAHGTADEVVPCTQSKDIEERLRSFGKTVIAEYIDGGDHFLRPVTTRQKVTLKHCREWLEVYHTEGPNDFQKEEQYDFPCGEVTYRVDFSGGRAAIGPLE